jgi:dienelactone hydrolase
VSPVGGSPRRGHGLGYAITAVVGLGLVVALMGQTRPRGEHGAAPPPSPSAPGSVAADTPLGSPLDVEFMSRGNRLKGVLFPPRLGARASLLVYNHGSEQDPDVMWLGDVGRFYQSHGFAVLFPWRQGCSGSGGTFWSERYPIVGDESDTAAREERNVRALEDELVDVRAAIDYGRALPVVDPAKVYVGGASFGGLLALMAAGASPGLKGAVICSGAAWTYKGSTTRGQEKLAALARAAKIPLFFMQAENDFNPHASEALGETMTEAGLPHVAKLYPRFGTTQLEGHAAFCNRGESVWGDDVLAFLKAE